MTMPMMPLFLRPGQQLKEFTIYRKAATVDERGRVTYAPEPEPIETVMGTIAEASQREKMEWSQMGHQITHRIVLRGRSKGDAHDEVRQGSRIFTVQGKHDPVQLGFFSTLYCLERLGVTSK